MKNLFSVVFTLIVTTAFSQGVRCGTVCSGNLDELLISHAPVSRSVITIPVVFHIVWRDSSDNIPDARITSQLDVLNTDFRALNDQLKYLSSAKRSLAADMEIEFCLAAVDPQGIPTTGILRYKSEVENIGTQNTPTIPSKAFIKHKNLGGADAWDTQRYLNIWVGKFQDGAILAESKFPWDNLPEEDGIRIDPAYVGVNCNGSPKKQFALGRTLTHEVGHYLGLLHPWSADCATGDYVEDTPPQRSPYYGCMPQVMDDACGSVPLVENFMQFSDDACLALFTHGQKERVYQMLLQYRTLLLNNNISCFKPTFADRLTEDNVRIYPNPTSHCISIDLKLNRESNIRVEIFDTSGKLILKDIVKVLLLRPIELSFTQSGIYFIRLTGNENTLVRKVVVM